MFAKTRVSYQKGYNRAGIIQERKSKAQHLIQKLKSYTTADPQCISQRKPAILFAASDRPDCSFPVPLKSKAYEIKPRIRVHFGKGLFVGPGKAELLEHIDRSGSISDAAKAMNMSYMRAWTLVKSLERGFTEPLVTRSRGGSARGGAKLSETGRQVVSLYREMEASSKTAVQAAGERLKKLLKA